MLPLVDTTVLNFLSAAAFARKQISSGLRVADAVLYKQDAIDIAVSPVAGSESSAAKVVHRTQVFTRASGPAEDIVIGLVDAQAHCQVDGGCLIKGCGCFVTQVSHMPDTRYLI